MKRSDTTWFDVALPYVATAVAIAIAAMAANAGEGESIADAGGGETNAPAERVLRETYILELLDDGPYIVGEDGARRPIAVIDRDEYEAIKGDVAKMMKSMNSSPSDRVKLHGKIVHTFIDENNHVKGEVHADGYQHVEPFRTRSPRVASVKRKAIEAARPKSGYRGIYSKRYLEMLEKRQKAKEPKVVTLTHDAATGKDTVK